MSKQCSLSFQLNLPLLLNSPSLGEYSGESELFQVLMSNSFPSAKTSNIIKINPLEKWISLSFKYKLLNSQVNSQFTEFHNIEIFIHLQSRFSCHKNVSYYFIQVFSIVLWLCCCCYYYLVNVLSSQCLVVLDRSIMFLLFNDWVFLV